MTLPDLETHIRVRAYFIWLGEGRPLWHHERHWARAEAEIAAERMAEMEEGSAAAEALRVEHERQRAGGRLALAG